MTDKKILVAMSGGVDSAVTALLLKEAGYECVGVTAKLHTENGFELGSENSCCTDRDIEDAKVTAGVVGIPHFVMPLGECFKEKVIEPFVLTYECGGTPNPCVRCNRYIKFKALLDKSAELGLGYIATGHYAKVEKNEDGRFLLKKADDLSKDQSYVLYNLTQSQLSKIIFPLGSLQKSEVREIAARHGFSNAHKHDSQDICFIPDGDYAAFIERFTGKTYPKGNFIDTEGKILGTHNGIIRYTIGQRKGLGIALGKPMFVCDKNINDNTVTLCSDAELYRDELDATDINLISVDKLEGAVRVKAKVRYKHEEQWATVTQPTPDTLHVKFDEPQRAISKGQSVVLYDGDTVVGGGIIL